MSARRVGPLVPATPLPTAVPPAAPSPVPRAADPKNAQSDRTLLHVLGGFAALGGLIMLLTLVPFLHSRLEQFGDPIGPTWFRITGHLVTVLVGLGLLFLAGQLARGKRRAWQLCVALFIAGTITNILKGPHPVSAVYSAAMAATLLSNRRLFRGASDPPSLFRLVRLGPVYIGAVFAFGFISLVIERHRISPDLTFGGGFGTIVKGLVGVSGSYTYHRHFFDEFFPKALLMLGAVGIVGALILLFRPLRARHPHTEQDWDHARRLIRLYGWDTLAYFALRDDKSFFFSADGEAMIAYTYVGGFALVSGDPIGAPGCVDRALDEFLQFCRDRSWRVAFLAARVADLPKYAEHGLRSFYLGDEAIVHCDTFSLDGAGMKGVRAAVRRVSRTHRFPAHPGIRRPGRPGRAVERDQSTVAREGAGTRFHDVPEPGHRGCRPQSRFPALCGARRARSAGRIPAHRPGVRLGFRLHARSHAASARRTERNDRIPHRADRLGTGRAGCRTTVDELRHVGRLFDEDLHFSLGQRIAKRAVVDVLNPFCQIKSLYDFNAKFSPKWLSRVLVYQEPTDLPRVGLLYAGAEGFLSIPGFGELFVPKAVGGVSSQPTAA